jgi:hypothetical protein
MSTIGGSCLCGVVRFECDDEFELFHLCHCTQCQKISGSAHVSNIFTQSNNITWLHGESAVKRYDVPGRTLTNAFCEHCGCSLPYLSSSGRYLIVPAGCLDSKPSAKPQDHIFWHERADWYDEIGDLQKFEGFSAE